MSDNGERRARRLGVRARIIRAIEAAGYEVVRLDLYRCPWPGARVAMTRDGERVGSDVIGLTWHRLARQFERVYNGSYRAQPAKPDGEPRD